MSAVMLSERDDGSHARVGAALDSDRRADLHQRAAQLDPLPGETACAYAARLSARLASVTSPDFVSRLLSRSTEAAEAGRRLRMLSIGTSTGGAERMLLRACTSPVELVLTGDDEEALSVVVGRFEPRHHVSCRVVDLEAGLARWKERFDVVFSHATLSRLVRLEPLLHDLAKLLAPEGELWVSREQAGPAGRHGERLRHWLHARFVAVDEHSSDGIGPLGIGADLALPQDLGRIRAGAVEDRLLLGSGRPATRLDGIYALASAH